ncbi:MAG: hypothetical protein AAFO04_29940 [Cyanobacteria bacterium J06592_8]
MMKTNSAIQFCQFSSAFIFLIVVLLPIPAHSHNSFPESFSELKWSNSEPPAEPRGNSSDGGGSSR